jgi:hypothetical protein
MEKNKKIEMCVLMSRQMKDIIETSGILIGIGLMAIIGSIIRFIFTNSIINFYIIAIGIALLIIGLIMHIITMKK